MITNDLTAAILMTEQGRVRAICDNHPINTLLAIGAVLLLTAGVLLCVSILLRKKY